MTFLFAEIHKPPAVEQLQCGTPRAKGTPEALHFYRQKCLRPMIGSSSRRLPRKEAYRPVSFDFSLVTTFTDTAKVRVVQTLTGPFRLLPFVSLSQDTPKQQLTLLDGEDLSSPKELPDAKEEALRPAVQTISLGQHL